MDFTNYEYNVYNEIQKDEMLRSFFVDLTNRAQGIISFEREKINKANNVIKPSFNELLNDVTTLEKEGIVTAKEGFDLYSCVNEKLYEQNTPYFIIFSTLKFYGILFDASDIEHMQKYKWTEKYIKKLEEDYKHWLASYKLSPNGSAQRKIEQYEKKIEKLKSKGKIDDKEKTPFHHAIYELRRFIRMDQEKKSKIEFFKERNVEKAEVILSIHDKIKKLSEEYDKYLSNKKNAESKTSQMSINIYDRVLEEINTNSMVEFDTSEIEKKVFKLLILNKLVESRFVWEYATFELNVTKDEESKYDFDTDAVKWFIRTKKQNFNELFDSVFNNFETSIEEISQKVLKK